MYSNRQTFGWCNDKKLQVLLLHLFYSSFFFLDYTEYIFFSHFSSLPVRCLFLVLHLPTLLFNVMNALNNAEEIYCCYIFSYCKKIKRRFCWIKKKKKEKEIKRQPANKPLITCEIQECKMKIEINLRRLKNVENRSEWQQWQQNLNHQSFEVNKNDKVKKNETFSIKVFPR